MSNKAKTKARNSEGEAPTLPPMTSIIALVAGTIESVGMELVNIQYNKSKGDRDVSVGATFYPPEGLEPELAGDQALGAFQQINAARSNSGMGVLDIRYNRNPSSLEINMNFVLRIPTPPSEEVVTEGTTTDGSTETTDGGTA